MVNNLYIVICLLVFTYILTGCGENISGDYMADVSMDDYQVSGNSYISDFQMVGFADKYQVKGTVHIDEAGREECIATVFSKCNTEVGLTGNFGSEEGSMRLIYLGQDGNEKLIYEGVGTINESIKINKGSGNIVFVGEKENSSINFDLCFARDKDVNFNFHPLNPIGYDVISPEENEIDSFIGENNNEFSYNLPECISRVDDGFSADTLCMSLQIDEPGNVIVVAETKSGTLGIQILDGDGNVYFDEEDIGTDIYKISLDHSDNYLFMIHAENHTGHFSICKQVHTEEN